jgi:hypothetical protein
MTRIFWTVSVAALCAAIGCEELGQDVGDDRAAAAGQGDDPGPLDPEEPSCTADSLDSAGCPCDAGAVPKQCWIAAAETAGKAECAYGTQSCESSGDAEVDAAAVWGPCLPTASGTEEGPCGDVPDPGCTDTAGCDPEACCDARVAECSEAGETSAVCDLLDDVCRTTICTELFQVCDPTMLPVSPLCARMAYTCFGFRVNKCLRESLDSCVAAVGDEALCTAWDEACSDREDYCAELLGVDTAEPSDGDEENKGGGQYSYECTDWGHIFDPCWASYLACGQGDPGCAAALQTCLSAQGDIYQPFCEGPPDGGDPGKDHPTDDPGGGEGGKRGDGDGDAPDPT